jgi:hypothetical protein
LIFGQNFRVHSAEQIWKEPKNSFNTLLALWKTIIALEVPFLSFGGISQRLWQAKPPNRQAGNFPAPILPDRNFCFVEHLSIIVPIIMA